MTVRRARWMRAGGQRALQADRGAVAAEYALLAALIAMVIIVAVALLGTNLVALYNDTASSIPS